MQPKDILDFNPLLSDRVRLAIMTSLSTQKGKVDFTSLLNSLELTRGNLSAHLSKLENGGLISVKKEFVERKPRTTYLATKKGKKALMAYLSGIERLLKSTK